MRKTHKHNLKKICDTPIEHATLGGPETLRIALLRCISCKKYFIKDPDKNILTEQLSIKGG